MSTTYESVAGEDAKQHPEAKIAAAPSAGNQTSYEFYPSDWVGVEGVAKISTQVFLSQFRVKCALG